MHETIRRSSECRDFNRRAALLLQRLEDAGCSRLADRAMGLLAACNPRISRSATASSAPERLWRG